MAVRFCENPESAGFAVRNATIHRTILIDGQEKILDQCKILDLSAESSKQSPKNHLNWKKLANTARGVSLKSTATSKRNRLIASNYLILEP